MPSAPYVPPPPPGWRNDYSPQHNATHEDVPPPRRPAWTWVAAWMTALLTRRDG